MSLSSLLLAPGALTLQRQGTAQDASGGATRSPWVTISTYDPIRADVQPASSSIRERYAQQQIFVTHTIFLDQDIGALPSMRLTLGTRTFLVHGYSDPAGRGRGNFWLTFWTVDVEEQLS